MLTPVTGLTVAVKVTGCPISILLWEAVRVVTLPPSILSDTAREVLGARPASPEYFAVTDRMPGGNVDVTSVARPFSTGIGGARRFDPSRKRTVPVGIAADAGVVVTVAESVTGRPTKERFGAAVSPVIVDEPLTVWLRLAWLGSKSTSPEYLAHTVVVPRPRVATVIAAVPSTRGTVATSLEPFTNVTEPRAGPVAGGWTRTVAVNVTGSS